MTDQPTETQKKCINCQSCCKFLMFPGSGSREESEFFKARELEVIKGKFGTRIIIPHICPKLDPVKGCTIYEARPLACRLAKLDDWCCKLSIKLNLEQNKED